MQSTSPPIRALTPRDVEALELLARFSYLERRQLQQLLFADRKTTTRSAMVMTQRTLRRLSTYGLVEFAAARSGSRSGGSSAPIYRITTSGARKLSDQAVAIRAPRGAHLVRHSVTSADVLLAFDRSARNNPGHALIDFVIDRDARRAFGRLAVIPDLYVVYASPTLELHAFVEVDLGTEVSRVIEDKISRYLETWRSGAVHTELGVWPTVLFVANTPTRARLLARTIARVVSSTADADRVRAGTEFGVTTISELTERGPLEPIWTIGGRPTPESLLPTEERAAA